jgi:hypothetical protein
VKQCIAVCKRGKGWREGIVILIVDANEPKTIIINEAMNLIEICVVIVFAPKGCFNVKKDILCGL